MKPALLILIALNAFLLAYSVFISYQYLVSERQGAFLMGASGVGMMEYLNDFNAGQKSRRSHD